MCLAVPGKIVSIDETQDIMRCGKVDFGGIIKSINLAFVPDAGIDDYVLVHAGFAIGIIQDEDDVQMLAEIQAMNGEP